jgi:hypothetical protein
MERQVETGWTGEGPDAGPAMPMTSMVLATRQHEGDTLAIALARSQAQERREFREAAAGAVDADERAANLVARGLMPGQVSELNIRLADTQAQLADEEAKLERAAKRQERIRRDHAAGKIDVFDIARMQAADTDEGDPAAVERLTRRRDSLQRQLAEAMQLMAPQRAPEDPLEAASRRAHQVFREVTRQRMADAQAGRAAPRERRPFASASRGGLAVRSEHCVYCTEAGVDDQTSYLLHSDPEFAVPVTSPEQAAQAERAEADRLMALGYSAETARLAARPLGPGREIAR